MAKGDKYIAYAPQRAICISKIKVSKPPEGWSMCLYRGDSSRGFLWVLRFSPHLRRMTSISMYLLYLCPSLPVVHRPSTTPRHRTLFCAALAIPVQLVPCCFSSASMSRLELLRGRSLFLFPCGFQVRACCVVLSNPEGVSDPAPLPPLYLFGHWFLSRSLPQISISDLLLPTDFVDAPQTVVEECLNLLFHRLCCPPCLTSVEQDSVSM